MHCPLCVSLQRGGSWAIGRCGVSPGPVQGILLGTHERGCGCLQPAFCLLHQQALKVFSSIPGGLELATWQYPISA